jgi:LPS-assembly protein
MRSQLTFVITAGWLCHLFLAAPLVTSQALPQTPSPGAAATANDQGSPCHIVLTAPPVFGKPEAGKPSPAPKITISEEQPVKINARQCEKNGDEYSLHGDVEIEFEEYTFRGDNVSYNNDTGEATAEGNAALDGGFRDIHITASRATYNVRKRTGKFYDVKGTTGARFKGKNVTLTSSSPIAFTGKLVEQTGPDEFVLHHGSVTSCELPRPKWTFNAGKIILRVGESAKVYNSTFRLKGIPVIYLPYANPPVERLGRQSGFLVPNIGTSNTMGTILGDSFYWAINRSADATLGGEYLSKRGWAFIDSFRSIPSRTSFLNVNYFQVLDRGIPGTDAQGQPITVNQGGEEAKLNGEAMFAHQVRGVASLEYLSSFVFRLAFSPNFSQAVDSEVNSTAFLTKNLGAYSLNAFGSRYQNFQSTTPDDVITILHVPGFESSGIDQPILGSPVYGGYDIDAEGLRRSEPGFDTPLVGRFEIAPDVSLPLHLHGWSIRPDLILNDTVYTQQQIPTSPNPIPTHNVLNRRMIEASVALAPPTLVKVFDGTWEGRKVKHTIEPKLIYRYTNGVEDFANIIRFDVRDVYSNTNELEYSLNQRLYFKRANDDCSQRKSGPALQESNGQLRATQTQAPAATCAPAGGDEFFSWELKQKYFMDETFGGAVVTGQRNVLFTTVTFSGIAFLTQPRLFSPVVSRVRLRTSSNSDAEWELDYDTVNSRINSNTIYTAYHFGDVFVGASVAYMQDRGQVVNNSSTGQPLPPCVPHQFIQPPCVPQVFNQARMLLGFGSPSKHGFSAAGNVGYDFEFNVLQYATAQTAYNWDCCGINFEYRRFSLGSVRNENQFRFAFTLANIGTFGNLRRQTRLF